MKEYMFIAGTAERWEIFERECSKALTDGWQPQGGISVAFDSEGKAFYSQAFVR